MFLFFAGRSRGELFGQYVHDRMGGWRWRKEENDGAGEQDEENEEDDEGKEDDDEGVGKEDEGARGEKNDGAREKRMKMKKRKKDEGEKRKQRKKKTTAKISLDQQLLKKTHKQNIEKISILHK